MKKWSLYSLSLLLLLSFSGCVPTPSVKVDPSLTPVSHIKALTGLDSIAFEWKPITSDVRIDGVYIYRAVGAGGFEKIKTIKDRYATHFTDKNLDPNSSYTYRFSTYTSQGAQSPMSDPIALKTVPMMKPVSFIEAVSHLPRQVKILWRPHQHERVGGYIVERRKDNGEFKKIKTLEGKLQAEYIDMGLKDNTTYVYRVIAFTYDKIQTKPSETVEATTKPLPVNVEGIKATTDIAKQIKVTWNPSPEKDIDHYTVYRSLVKDMFYVKRAETKGPEYIDEIDKDGNTNYYKVTATDVDRLESDKPATGLSGQTLGKPLRPVITHANIQDGKSIVQWIEGGDARCVSYILLKKYRVGLLFKEAEIDMGDNTQFEDVDIEPGRKYYYSVKCVDQFGIQSLKTNSAQLLLPEIRK